MCISHIKYLLICSILFYLGPSEADSFSENGGGEKFTGTKVNPGCLTKDQIINKYTPAVLFSSLAQCVRDKKYATAAILNYVAGAYGYFDAHRVADQSAGQVMRVLKMQAVSSIDMNLNEEFGEILRNYRSSGKVNSEICPYLKELGKPEYFPKYMVEYGLNAFINEDDSKVLLSVDQDKLWEDTLREYIKCGGSE